MSFGVCRVRELGRACVIAWIFIRHDGPWHAWHQNAGDNAANIQIEPRTVNGRMQLALGDSEREPIVSSYFDSQNGIAGWKHMITSPNADKTDAFIKGLYSAVIYRHGSDAVLQVPQRVKNGERLAADREARSIAYNPYRAQDGSVYIIPLMRRNFNDDFQNE
jgi:hypothetical protein